jgi:hypothetical protein
MTISAFERSRWRDGRFACYAPRVMPQDRAFDSDFRFYLFFLSQANQQSVNEKGFNSPWVSFRTAFQKPR